MENTTYGDIIFFALVAVYLGVKLYSVLGKKNEKDEGIGGGSGSPQQNNSTYEEVSSSFGGFKTEPKAVEAPKVEISKELEEYNFANDDVKNDVKQIITQSKGLTVTDFVTGAKAAFGMILTAFTQGDKDTLKDLLSTKLYNDFSKKIDELKKKDLTAFKSLISIKLDEFSNASIIGNTAKISLKFTSEQINFVKDDNGELVDGDVSFIETVEDEWIFERNIKSSDPNWKIVAV